MNQEPHVFLPAEWFPQSGVQLTWPHAQTDWQPLLKQVLPCYQQIARVISERQKLLIVCDNAENTQLQLKDCYLENITLVEVPANDTWARDHAGITIIENEQPVILDFKFNGWGLKFPADHDNLITQRLFASNSFQEAVGYQNLQQFVMEGGSFESDGEGTLLTTAECLLSPNRNGHMSKEAIEAFLKETFQLQQVLWLHHGYLEGDDTDSHIDTLVRFCDPQTMVYVTCQDQHDPHYESLRAMEAELKSYTNLQGEPYRLLPLPMADVARDQEGQRLPATYANFLIINGAVLLPFYGSEEKDEEARKVLQEAFPQHEIIGINCEPLIQQHGSLHCITMQYPLGVL